MRKVKMVAMLVLAFSTFASAALAADKKKNKDEELVLPDTELVDIPTAGILDYYGFQSKARAYSGGGVLTALTFGVQERLNLGVSMSFDRFIGSVSPIKMRRPEIQVKFRFYDGAYYTPAVAVGYEGQGYYYNSDSKKYMEKGKGLYLVSSKELGVSNLVLHGGLNVSDFDSGYLFSFLGANYTLADTVSFMLEYDNVFHSDDPSRLNFGTRIFVTPYFQLDLAVRELNASGRFENGVSRKSERIVQLRYNTSF